MYYFKGFTWVFPVVNFHFCRLWTSHTAQLLTASSITLSIFSKIQMIWQLLSTSAYQGVLDIAFLRSSFEKSLGRNPPWPYIIQQSSVEYRAPFPCKSRPSQKVFNSISNFGSFNATCVNSLHVTGYVPICAIWCMEISSRISSSSGLVDSWEKKSVFHDS